MNNQGNLFEDFEQPRYPAQWNTYRRQSHRRKQVQAAIDYYRPNNKQGESASPKGHTSVQTRGEIIDPGAS